MNDWYRDWQHQTHRDVFDGRARLDRRNLRRNYEGFNDVQLLNERVERSRSFDLLEVGCATGEFFRYLRRAYPRARYYGTDISRPAVERARQKYPTTTFVVTDPMASLADQLAAAGAPAHPEIVYSKDVIQHQVHPFAFLDQLIQLASEAVIFRGRTRDAGPTELDPERSCQHHYAGWMPFLVLNLDEVIQHIQQEVPESEIVIYRHHMVLGGRHERWLPKELYLKDSGTAETAVGVFKQTASPGRVTIEDRTDMNPAYTWDYRLKHAARQALDALWPQRAHASGH